MREKSRWVVLVLLAALGVGAGAIVADAAAKPTTSFYFPWTSGWKATVTQLPGGDTSHNGLLSQAYDFDILDGKLQVRASAPGVLWAKRKSNETEDWGTVVVLKHPDGTCTRYAHMKPASLTPKKVGAAINQGEVLGAQGETGFALGAHLHFQREVCPKRGAAKSFTQSLKVTFVEKASPGYNSTPTSKNPAGIKCASKNATIVGTTGSNKIYGTDKVDVIVARGGSDTVHARGGNDLVCGGDGKDILYGEGGKDTLIGDGGNDTVRGGSGNDTVNGNKGDDTLYGDAGTDTCNGGPGTDTIKPSCEFDDSAVPIGDWVPPDGGDVQTLYPLVGPDSSRIACVAFDDGDVLYRLKVDQTFFAVPLPAGIRCNFGDNRFRLIAFDNLGTAYIPIYETTFFETGLAAIDTDGTLLWHQIWDGKIYYPVVSVSDQLYAHGESPWNDTFALVDKANGDWLDVNEAASDFGINGWESHYEPTSEGVALIGASSVGFFDGDLTPYVEYSTSVGPYPNGGTDDLDRAIVVGYGFGTCSVPIQWIEADGGIVHEAQVLAPFMDCGTATGYPMPDGRAVVWAKDDETGDAFIAWVGPAGEMVGHMFDLEDGQESWTQSAYADGTAVLVDGTVVFIGTTQESCDVGPNAVTCVRAVIYEFGIDGSLVRHVLGSGPVDATASHLSVASGIASFVYSEYDKETGVTTEVVRAIALQSSADDGYRQRVLG